ncbi:MAG: hypothetical protein Q4A28_02270 [Brachymonas sp.]|nr:hypothetical protein [Brachymonas sp.]
MQNKVASLPHGLLRLFGLLFSACSTLQKRGANQGLEPLVLSIPAQATFPAGFVQSSIHLTSPLP